MGRDRIEDPDSRTILYDGASISQLARLFKMDNRTVTAKIHNVNPCGRRNNYPIYHVREAAPFLCLPQGNIEEAIKRMHHMDLPPLLQKEFWNGLRAKQAFEEAQGDLWRTAEVIDTLAEVAKTMRMTILLTRDLVERQTELSEKQRGIVNDMIDGLLTDLNKSLIERFQNAPERILTENRSPGREVAENVEPEDPAEGL